MVEDMLKRNKISIKEKNIKNIRNNIKISLKNWKVESKDQQSDRKIMNEIQKFTKNSTKR